MDLMYNEYYQLSKKYNIPYETVRKICNYQFKFIKERIADPNDHKDILVNRLFKFRQKKRFKMEDSKQIFLQFDTEDIDSAKDSPTEIRKIFDDSKISTCIVQHYTDEDIYTIRTEMSVLKDNDLEYLIKYIVTKKPDIL